MTDSIKTALDLTKLLPDVRMDVPAKLCTVTTPWGEITARYTKPSHQKSGMAETKTKWIVRCKPDESDNRLGDLPFRIDADLNIPNAIVGHNLEHGTSVYAAGSAALELQRIWLAQHGLPKEQLDLLTAEDIKLRGVTVTFCHQFDSLEEAIDLVTSIDVTGRILVTNYESHNSKNLTVILPGRHFVLIVYIKTELKHCKWQDGAPVSDLIERTSNIVRIEARLGEQFLNTRNLLTLESWRRAYEKGLYADIYDQTVRKQLRLGKERLRHKAPREEVYALLTPTEARLLRGYIAGKAPLLFKNIAESTSPLKRLSALRLRILSVANIDIDIPWQEHVKLRCFELDECLQYPGDYHPLGEHARWCFCKTNWANLKELMGQKYKEVLAEAKEK